jgi:aminopeptidase YwaD
LVLKAYHETSCSCGGKVIIRNLPEKAETYLRRLCLDHPHRRVGSRGNRAATDFFAQVVASFGFEVEAPEFECIDWTQDGASLLVEGEPFDVQVSPYSLGGQERARLAVVSTMEGLEAVEAADKVLLIQGDLAREQLMPKNFPFYNPDRHQRIIHLLEERKPRAIVAATSRNPELAGGVYPFPLIEDGDFDIPSVHMTEEEGHRLAAHEGQDVSLVIRAERLHARGNNVIARKGSASGPRVVLCAHIDSKEDTPGALDNASGVVVLLLLAELLEDYSGDLGVEIVAFNGEDYYSAPGQVLYLRENADNLSEMVLAINIDVAGYHEGNTAYSLYDCPENIAASIRKIFSALEDSVEGEQWYQSDHSIFIQQQVPALAITSDRFMELSTHVTHTPQDSPDIVDCARLANVALALRDLVADLNRH